jgi:hypothetical protein
MLHEGFNAVTALQERLAHCDRCGKRLGGEGDIHTCTPTQQEPVATVQCINGITIGYLEVMQPVGTKLYTTPPAAQRTWVGLTKADINEIWKGEPMLLPWDMTRTLAIEQRLKEKNNG